MPCWSMYSRIEGRMSDIAEEYSGHVMPCHVMSCHVMFYLNHYIMPCHILICIAISWHVMSCHYIPRSSVGCLTLPKSTLAMSTSHFLFYMYCHVMFCHVMFIYIIISCHVMFWYVLLFHGKSCHAIIFLDRPLNVWHCRWVLWPSHVLYTYYPVLSCHAVFYVLPDRAVDVWHSRRVPRAGWDVPGRRLLRGPRHQRI